MPKKKSPRSLEDMFSKKPDMSPNGNGNGEVAVGEEVEVFEPEPEDVETPSIPPKPAALAAHDEFLTACGDGFELTVEQAKFGIQESAGRMLDDYIRVGKRLIVLKHKLEYGQFESYVKEEFPFSLRVGQECMLIAKRVVGSKSADARAFCQVSSGNSKQKAVLLMGMGISDEEIENANESGEFLGRPLEEVGELSYRQLKEALRKTERDRDRARTQRDKAESKNEDLAEKIAILNADEEELGTPLTVLATEMGRTMTQFGRLLAAAQDADDEEIEEDGVGYFSRIMQETDIVRPFLHPFDPPEVLFGSEAEEA